MDIFGKIDIGNMMKKKMMGGDDNYKEAYIRIQNRSSHSRIRVSIPRVKNAKASSSSSSSLDGLLSGDVRANSSLPDDGGGEVGPFANGRRYARVTFGKDDQNDNDDNEDDGICGRLVGKLSLDNGGGGGGGKGGLVVFEARVVSVHAGGGGGDRGGAATLRLISNDDGWRCEDDRGSSSSPIKLAADVTEMSRRGNGGNGGDVMVFWKVELRIYDDIDTTRWMEVLGERIEDVPFNRIGLPGEFACASSISRNMRRCIGEKECVCVWFISMRETHPLIFMILPSNCLPSFDVPPPISHSRHARFRYLHVRSRHGRESR
jgi:hypothetical protein